MEIKITDEWLQVNGACAGAVRWVKTHEDRRWQCLYDELFVFSDMKRLEWVNWALVRLMTRENQVRYAVYAAEKVVHIYERNFPGDRRPLNAINAAKAWLEGECFAPCSMSANADSTAADVANAVNDAYIAYDGHYARDDSSVTYDAYASYAAASVAANAVSDAVSAVHDAYTAVAFSTITAVCKSEKEGVMREMLEFGKALIREQIGGEK